MHYKFHFFSLITNVVVTSSFCLCSKICADKIATSYVFKSAAYLPTLQTCCQNHLVHTCSPDLPDPQVPRPAVECPSDAQRNALSLRFFTSTVKVCCFQPCVFWKLAKFGHWWSWENMVVIFPVFVIVHMIKWQRIRTTSKRGNLPTCSQEL